MYTYAAKYDLLKEQLLKQALAAEIFDTQGILLMDKLDPKQALMGTFLFLFWIMSFWIRKQDSPTLYANHSVLMKGLFSTTGVCADVNRNRLPAASSFL